MNRESTTFVSLLVAAVALIALPSLGCQSKMYTTETEAKIAKILETQGIAGTATCPKRVAKKKGGKFACELRLSNSDVVTIDVEIVDKDGKTKETLRDHIVSKKKAEATAMQLLTKLGLTEPKVKCPPDAKSVKGRKFTCAGISAEGIKLNVDAVINDDKGNTSMKLRETIIDAKKIAQQVVDKLTEKKIGVTVNCGQRFRAVKASDKFQCTATDKDKVTKAVAVTVTDGKGNISWELLGENKTPDPKATKKN